MEKREEEYDKFATIKGFLAEGHMIGVGLCFANKKASISIGLLSIDEALSVIRVWGDGMVCDCQSIISLCYRSSPNRRKTQRRRMGRSEDGRRRTNRKEQQPEALSKRPVGRHLKWTHSTYSTIVTTSKYWRLHYNITHHIISHYDRWHWQHCSTTKHLLLGISFSTRFNVSQSPVRLFTITSFPHCQNWLLHSTTMKQLIACVLLWVAVTNGFRCD